MKYTIEKLDKKLWEKTFYEVMYKELDPELIEICKALGDK